MEYSYKSELTREHHLEFQKYIWARLLNQPAVKRWHRGVSSTLFIAMAAFVVFAIDFAGSHPSLRMSVFLITAVVSIFGWYISGRLFQEFATRRWTSGTGTMLGETTQTISDSGILEVGLRHRFECSWKAVTDVIETPNLIIFLTDPAKGIMCPRTSIPDEEYKALLAYSREQIAK